MKQPDDLKAQMNYWSKEYHMRKTKLKLVKIALRGWRRKAKKLEELMKTKEMENARVKTVVDRLGGSVNSSGVVDRC